MRHLFLLFCFVSIAASVFAQQKDDALYKNFVTPPNEAKPRVWWHWMNGNITQKGIREDLEWMKRVGIGGFQNFDAALATPQIVKKRLTYMTPDWMEVFKLTTRLADSMKLEMAIAGSPGWSESGGPWVKPEDGMKKIVWNKISVSEGEKNIRIAPPPDVTGPFQNIPKQPDFGTATNSSDIPEFYKDIAIVAFKLPGADKSLRDMNAVVSSSGGNFSLSQLTDGDLNTSVLLPRDTAAGYGWIQFSFPTQVTIKSVTMVGGGNPGRFGRGASAADSRKLEASDDGVSFRYIATILPGAVLEQTINIPPTTAKYFRVTVRNPPVPVNLGAAFGLGNLGAQKDPGGTEIAELVLHTSDRIQMFEEKAAFAPVGDLDKKATRPSSDVIDPADVMDISDRLQPDGTVNWTVPSGKWEIIRFGYSLLGITNHPASAEATGLEVDKLDPVAVKQYFTNYLDQYRRATGGLMGAKGGLQFMVTDSWEAGAQNWTENLPKEFETRRGYNIISWLPAIAGYIIKSSEASEDFLFDFRKTLSDMVAEYHYDNLTKILAGYGMKRYSESHETGRAFIGDGMEVKRTSAVPMSALWVPNPFINQNNQTKHTVDIRESASVAHIYGQNLVAAESLTALGVGGYAWSYYPGNLKPSADLELASGLNRFVIHTSVHQPVDDKIPGLGLGPFGQWYNRHETWAEQAVAWNAYLGRSSYLLQQGKFVADILYLYGEDNNITSLFGEQPPSIPDGYNYDYVNTDALINLLSVKDGKIVTPSGMSYRVLILDSSTAKISVPVLRKLKKLVDAGAVITGIKPVASPSLSDDPDEFKKLVSDIWTSGRTNVSQNSSIAEVLNNMRLVPDFTYSKPNKDTKLLFVHRKLNDRDIYWINSRNNFAQDIEADFRMSGKIPELWHPENGLAEPASYSISGGVTKVQIHLAPDDAVFVVFKDKAVKNSFTLPKEAERQLAEISGSWNVKFQSHRGAPSSAVFESLKSYTENADNGIKYFSGTANYTKEFDVNPNWLSGKGKIWLDLGDVKNLAEVVVNGKSLGIVWKNPFKVDVTKALKPGKNRVEIKVTNLWVNRLIGDMQPGVTEKITYTTMPFYQADSKLQPSGLLGPVKLMKVE